MNGAQAHIRGKYPNATYVHCASHCLNLVISTSSQCRSIRDCWSTVQTITAFLQYGKRMACLESCLASSNADSKTRRLQTFTYTRWVDRHDAILRFKEFLPGISNALEEISGCPAKGDNSAYALLKSIDGEFIVALTVSKNQ